ncbi:hypothetical protein F4823DRAFT_621169 [Ustulina deusta]|nr:hypothetical protein F4823DRAFT_621169 [Ustulina deusta]
MRYSLNEIPLEELDLSTPKLPSDDSTAPPWLLPHVLSPRSTELAWPSTAIAIRERSPCRAALGSHHQPQSKNRDVFPASPQPPQETVPLIGGEQGQRTHQIYGPLENGICSIIKSVAGKERMIDHSNAVQLKEDLRTLLDLTESRLLCTHRADDNLGSKLNLMNHLISSASAIAINMTCSFRFPCSLLPEAHIRWKQRRTTLCVDTSILDVTRKFSLNYPVQTRRDVRISDSDGIYTGLRIAFKPKGSTFALCIEVNHCQLVDGSFSSIPRLSICNTVSSDSLVFKVAASGSVSDLMKLLTSGQAHIRDHDEDGCSLLHHSLKNPPMCQFLVQCGLDVDETGHFLGRRRKTVMTPLHISWMEWENVETTRTLLAGGADPTIETDILVGVASCLYYYTWEDKDLTILYDVVNLCTHFGVFDVRNGLGKTLFLSLFRVGKGDYDFQIGQIKGLEFLLNRGSNINDKTTSGSTCLHILFCSNLEPGWTENWLSLIIFAIRQGADVYSADIYGVTVSEIAYAKRVCYDLIADLGSYRGDVWDAALHACGYNILDFRTAL